MQGQVHTLTFMQIIMIKILNSNEVGNHVRISKYTNIFAKGYTPNWSKVVPWTNIIEALNGEEIVGLFSRNYKKHIKQSLELNK